MSQERYTLGEAQPDEPRHPGDPICCGTKYPVLLDGTQVAAIYEHPTKYKGGYASVSMRKIAWAGRDPGRENAFHSDAPLFHDFVSDHTTAQETLPEVARRVDRILKWRHENPEPRT